MERRGRGLRLAARGGASWRWPVAATRCCCYTFAQRSSAPSQEEALYDYASSAGGGGSGGDDDDGEDEPVYDVATTTAIDAETRLGVLMKTARAPHAAKKAAV